MVKAYWQCNICGYLREGSGWHKDKQEVWKCEGACGKDTMHMCVER